MIGKTALNHHPIDRPTQIHVGGQEHDILALQGSDRLVLVHQMIHYLVQTTVPLAAGARTRAGVRLEIADIFMLFLLLELQASECAAV